MRFGWKGQGARPAERGDALLDAPAAFPAGWHVHRFASLASTQDAAIGAANAGEPAPAAFLATEQTAGRGRDGRSWVSPPGNLYVSLLIRPGPGAPLGGCWSELAGVALFDAVLPHARGTLALKPPNDLLLDGAKLAGLLVDTALSPEGALDWVVIGAGVNLATAPALPDRPTAALGAAVAPESLAAAFATALESGLTDGWACVHASYAACLA